MPKAKKVIQKTSSKKLSTISEKIFQTKKGNKCSDKLNRTKKQDLSSISSSQRIVTEDEALLRKVPSEEDQMDCASDDTSVSGGGETPLSPELP